jgi:hypothetical protein
MPNAPFPLQLKRDFDVTLPKKAARHVRHSAVHPAAEASQPIIIVTAFLGNQASAPGKPAAWLAGSKTQDQRLITGR